MDGPDRRSPPAKWDGDAGDPAEQQDTLAPDTIGKGARHQIERHPDGEGTAVVRWAMGMIMPMRVAVGLLVTSGMVDMRILRGDACTDTLLPCVTTMDHSILGHIDK